MPRPIRRVVTGHDDQGKSIILSDGLPPHVLEKGTDIDFYEMWRTTATPVSVTATEQEPTWDHLVTGPVAGGVNFRCIDILPGHFSKWSARPGKSRPGMHRTETVDFGIVLENEVCMLLDESETILKAGDVVIQRGTDHAWINRTDAITRMAFVLVDATFSPALRAVLPDDMILGGVPNILGDGTE